MTNQIRKALVIALAGTFLTVGQAMAARVNVTVKNLTNGIYFTPLLVTAHDADTNLFEVGFPASEALQAMAEGGNIDSLAGLVGGEDGDTAINPAAGLLGPGTIVTDIYIDTTQTGNKYLSLVAMMLPTNDGFVGLDSLRIPDVPGTYRYFLYGYDAGTEANDELITGGGAPGAPGIPAAPGGDAGSGGTGVIGADANPYVHVHRGVVGDTDLAGGESDLDSSIHRWLNPVAEVVLEVNFRRFQEE